jgi:predicted Holliday junction resolvase-like endonuclease
MKINENTSLKTDMKTLVMIVMGIAIAVWTYAEINARIVHLETSKQLMEQDLLEASTQKPIDQEQFMLLEDLYKTVEKIEKRIEDMMHNKVNIEFITKQLEKALDDIEKLKDKQREFANGNGHG